jgi:hypothetical protein
MGPCEAHAVRGNLFEMNNTPEYPKQVSPQPEQRESPRYEKPVVKKIGNMSANTKQKTT